MALSHVNVLKCANNSGRMLLSSKQIRFQSAHPQAPVFSGSALTQSSDNNGHNAITDKVRAAEADTKKECCDVVAQHLKAKISQQSSGMLHSAGAVTISEEPFAFFNCKIKSLLVRSRKLKECSSLHMCCLNASCAALHKHAVQHTSST